MKPLVISHWSLVILFALSGCATSTRIFPPKPGEKTETIYLVDQGKHCDIIARIVALPPAARPGWKMPPHTTYLWAEYGWGDDGFYNAKKITLGITLKALFWKNPAVLHVVAMDKTPEKYFPYAGLIRINISEEGSRRFGDFLAATFKTDAAGHHHERGPGIYGESRFYDATGYYYFPNTCNVWTAHSLRAAGLPICLFNSVLATPVFDQASHYGTVIKRP